MQNNSWVGQINLESIILLSNSGERADAVDALHSRFASGEGVALLTNLDHALGKTSVVDAGIGGTVGSRLAICAVWKRTVTNAGTYNNISVSKN